jgi:hypothetical protein
MNQLKYLYEDLENQNTKINSSINELDNQQREINSHCYKDLDRIIRYTNIHSPDSASKTYGPATKIYSKYLEESEFQPWNPWFSIQNISRLYDHSVAYYK